MFRPPKGTPDGWGFEDFDEGLRPVVIEILVFHLVKENSSVGKPLKAASVRSSLAKFLHMSFPHLFKVMRIKNRLVCLREILLDNIAKQVLQLDPLMQIFWISNTINIGRGLNSGAQTIERCVFNWPQQSYRAQLSVHCTQI